MISLAKPLLGEEEKTAVIDVLNSGMLASGPVTEKFEKEFAEFIGTKYAIATASGTTALHLGLLSLGVKKGDEVIIPAFSFVATANSPLFCEAIPVFCDIDPQTFNIDPDKIEELITKKTKVIMPVHLYGQAADMEPILEIANKHDLKIFGDACQAHGAKYNGNMVGSFGDLECFSFYPTKNMTTSEGGMITTNNEEIAEKASSLRNHGREKTKWGYEHGCLGYNYRTTDIASAIGFEQLKKLPMFNKKRQENAHFLNKNLDRIDEIKIPYVLPKCEHVYHQYTIICKNRENIIQTLKEHDIGYGIYYPKPLHFYPHLKKYAHKNLKCAEETAQKVVSIPVHPALTNSDLNKIVDAFT